MRKVGTVETSWRVERKLLASALSKSMVAKSQGTNWGAPAAITCSAYASSMSDRMLDASEEEDDVTRTTAKQSSGTFDRRNMS